MKSKYITQFIEVMILIACLSLFVHINCRQEPINTESVFTNVIIKNSSQEDTVKVFVTVQSTDSVMGLFGITDTISWCKGYFYALQDSSYSSDRITPLEGVVVSFGSDNVPCNFAIAQGFPNGVNIFEFSINTAYEVFEISCEDGINSILRESVSDTVNWTTGNSNFEEVFTSATDTFPLINNINRRGVFPYRCTNCINMISPVPQNCFNLPDSCNSQSICQVARTSNIGGCILVEYLSKTN